VNFIETVRQIEYRRALRQFAARVKRRREEAGRQLDAATARFREQPCDRRLAELKQAIDDRLRFEVQVYRVVRLDPARFVAEFRAVA